MVVFCSAYLPMMLMASTEATAITGAVLLSVLWLKEKFYPKFDIPAVALVVGGCFGVVILGDRTEVVYSFSELVDLVKSGKSITYLVFIGIFFVFSIAAFIGLMYSLQQFEKIFENYVHSEYSTSETDNFISASTCLPISSNHILNQSTSQFSSGHF